MTTKHDCVFLALLDGVLSDVIAGRFSAEDALRVRKLRDKCCCGGVL